MNPHGRRDDRRPAATTAGPKTGRYSIHVVPTAAKALRRLPKQLQARIEGRIDALATAPRGAGVKRLSARDSEHRVRVGGVRVIFRIDDDAREVLVTAVRARDQAYR